MSTVPLDADAETLLLEHGVMIVDGDSFVTHDRPDGSTCCYMPLKAGHGQWLCAKCGQGGATIPPSWTVVASEPCVTCHGTGWYTNASDAIQEIFGSEIDCPDCHAGRPVVEVQTACKRKCIGRPRGYEDRNGIGRLCHCTDGRVTTFWTVGEVAPIVAGMEGRDIDGPHFRAWTALGGATAHGVAGLPERWGDLPGDPADLVGKFACFMEPVT